MPDRETIATYVLLARVLIGCEPYDGKGALVLLHSMEQAFGRPTSKTLNTALHLNALAGFGEDDAARRDARQSLSHVVDRLERLLVRPEGWDVPRSLG
jgi:hypothetical protein